MFLEKDSETEKKRLLFFIGMLIMAILGIILYLSITGNIPQSFYDVVNEYTAIHGSNKSAEKNLFYIFSILGIVAYIFYYFISQKKIKIKSPIVNEKIEDKSHLYVISSLLIFSAAYYFIYSCTNWLLITGMILSTILYTIDRTLVIPGISYFFISTYAICALYRIYVCISGQNSLNMITVVLICIISAIFIILTNKRNRKQLFLKRILIAEIFVPFTMLIYLVAKYKYEEQYIFINTPYKIQILIVTMIIFFVFEAILNAYKRWNTATTVGEVITHGVCIAIMSFNRYSGTGSIISSDLHHPFENIIGYSQIFELGQKPFTQYIPVSGMYSIVHGFFLSFFGHGQISFYYLVTNLFYLVIIILIVILLKKQLKNEWVLLISLIFPVIDYNRIILIVPIMLLLIYPNLIERKNLWLKVWFLSSFLHGLYYPVFGAAVCIGFLPLGIYQIITYIKTGELKKDVRKISFWVLWLISFVPVGMGGSLLAGTVKHMKAMAGQTIYADGITRFGQIIPGNFFSYIQLLSTRLIIYYIFSFLIVISIVWISIVLCLNVGNVYIDDKRMQIDRPIPACICLSFGIVLLISFSYTIIRMDINDIYARSAGVVYASFIMMIIIISKYMQKKEHFVFFGFAIFIIAATSAEGFMLMDSNSKLSSYYIVPENYVHVVNDQVERLGECFVEKSIYDSIEDAYNYTANMDKNDSYLGVVNNFGLFYLCGIKGDSVMELTTLKGFEAVQETVDLIRNNSTIVSSDINPINNYYFYHWLITSGEYIWNPETRVFIPNNGTMSLENILIQNQFIETSAEGAKLGRTAGSWGSSINTLINIFSDSNIKCNVNNTGTVANISFQQIINGTDADFMYIEFANQNRNYEYTLFDLNDNVVQDIEKYWYIKDLMKKDYNRNIVVIVSWTDEKGAIHSMNCRMEQGKLLIPLGGGRGWLLNKHSDIQISVMQGETAITVPEIKEINMLKLREVE